MNVESGVAQASEKLLNDRRPDESRGPLIQHHDIATTVSKRNIFVLDLVVDLSNAVIPIIVARSFVTKALVVHAAKLSSTNSVVTAVELYYNRRCRVGRSLRPVALTASVPKHVAIHKSSITAIRMMNTAPSALS
jgi:hypothetical protein